MDIVNYIKKQSTYFTSTLYQKLLSSTPSLFHCLILHLMTIENEISENLSTFYVPEYQEYENEYDISSYFSEENDNETLENTSMLSFPNKKRTRTSRLKNVNGCYTFTRTLNDVRVKIDCYATRSVMGTKIRSATTGIVNSMIVGKIDEDLFFKVRVVNGEVVSSAHGNDFYYDSPEEYERHMFIKVPQKIKERWVEKNRLARMRKDIQETKRVGKPEFTQVK